MNHPSTGADLTSVNRPPHPRPPTSGARVEAALTEAERIVDDMDPADFETDMMRVVVACARAVCIALENRG